MGRTASTVSADQLHQFAAWICAKRKSLHMTQDEMSQRLGLSKSYYNTIEKERRTPTARLMAMIAQRLGDYQIIHDIFDDATATALAQVAGDGDAGEDQAEMDIAANVVRPVDSIIRTYWGDGCADVRIESVPVAPILRWWGLHDEQIALIKPIKTLRDIEDGALLYARVYDAAEQSPDIESGFFCFINISEQNTFTAQKPELRLMHEYHFSFDDLRAWMLNAQNALEEIPITLAGEYSWYQVIGVLGRPLNAKDTPAFAPGTEDLGRETRRHLVDQIALLQRLEQKAQTTQTTQYVVWGHPIRRSLV